MANILLINAHYVFPSSPGRLNAAFVERARTFFENRSDTVRTIKLVDPWNIENEINNQVWADIVFLQFPLNSMGPPWPLKRYLDEVYTAGMDGRLAKGDGRSRSDPTRQYGSGGKMQDTKYMLSVTMNAPKSAFDSPDQTLFGGRSVDDLLAPLHINFAFFGLLALPTFSAHDVNKNPTIEDDFQRFNAYLTTYC